MLKRLPSMQLGRKYGSDTFSMWLFCCPCRLPARPGSGIGAPKYIFSANETMCKNEDRILVFIPAYRCAAQIARVMDQFTDTVQETVEAVLVVDNRSPDGTLQRAVACGKDRFRKTRLIAWVNDDNYGLGGSHKVAFRYAADQGLDYLVVLHGDDQADIRDLVPLLDSGVHRNVDCLLGARFMKGSRLFGYSILRTFGNRLYNRLFSLVVSFRIHDLGSGLNVYRLSSFRDFNYKRFQDDLTFNYVMLLASLHGGQKVRF